MIKIKNISGLEKTVHLKHFLVDETYDLDVCEAASWGVNEDFLLALDNSEVEVYFGDKALLPETAKALLRNDFVSSLAVDKNGIDQALSGNDWAVVGSQGALWDIGNDYDALTFDFVVPFDGIFFFDLKLKIINMVGCTAVEVALFKREEIEDDYWFIIDNSEVSGQEVIMSGATMYDFYEGERYCVKIKLYGDNPSAKISGDDDFTAWGFNFENNLYQKKL